MDRHRKNSFFRQWWAWVLIAAIITGVILAVIAFLPSIKQAGKPKVEQVYTSLTEIDVNGMTISEACEKVRAAGWAVRGVEGNNDPSEKSDCSDTNRTVIAAYWSKEKYLLDGNENSYYETVAFQFQNEAEEEGDANPTPADNTPDTSSSTTANTIPKCKTGDQYTIAENGHYVVGQDIAPGTYNSNDSVSFNLFKTQSDYTADNSRFIWLASTDKTVQLNNGNIIENDIGSGTITCK